MSRPFKLLKVNPALSVGKKEAKALQAKWK